MNTWEVLALNLSFGITAFEADSFGFSPENGSGSYYEGKVMRWMEKSLSVDIRFAEMQSPRRQEWIAFSSHWHLGNLL